MRLIKPIYFGLFVGLLCSALNASEIDLKLTTSDGSSQVSVVDSNATSVAAIDSTGNLTFKASLLPNGQPGTAGQVLQSNGTGVVPTWVLPTPLPSTLLGSTNTWTAQQTYSQSVTISSNLIVNNSGILSGNGSGLTNLIPGSLSSGVYSAITGIGTQSQGLNMNANLINNLAAPVVGTDAATKAYVDTSTTSATTILLLSTNSWTAPQTYSQSVTVSSNFVVNNGGILSGNGSGLTNLIPGSLSSGVYGAITGLGTQSQNLNMNTNLLNNLGTPVAGTDAATKNYVDVATAAANTTLLLSTNTWTAQQTYTKQISISTAVVLSGPFWSNGSAGSAGQALQSQGNGSAPTWVSSTTFLGGTAVLKQGPVSLEIVSKSISYAMTTADYAVIGDASGGSITITLPPASNAGMMVFIVKKDVTANNVSIAGGAGDTINGATPVNLTAQYQKRLLIADGGTTWYIVSQ